MSGVNASRRALVLGAPAAVAALALAPFARGAAEPAVAYTVANPQGDVPVYAYFPPVAPDRPIWVVMHGLKRNAADYYSAWLPHARAHGAILLAPQFDAAHWPKSWCYQLGNVMTSHGEPVPHERWAFTAIEHAVDEAARRARLSDAKFALYGHGGGAQFVQRYVLHTGGVRLTRALAANAGWYLVPSEGFPFPYGLRDAGIDADTLAEAFAAPLIVMIGLRDVRTDGVMRRNAQTELQGATRVARGQYFFEQSRQAAADLNLPFRWRLVEVPEGGHREGSMMPAAAALMTGAPR